MRGCCALASSDSLLLAVTLSTVTGLSEGWKPDSETLPGSMDWQAANDAARPADARARASLFSAAALYVPIDRSASSQLRRAESARAGSILASRNDSSHTQPGMASKRPDPQGGFGRKLCPLAGNIA